MDFFKHLTLDFAQVQIITRCLHALAITDGMHASEDALIRAFFDACKTDGASFDAVVKAPFDIAEAKTALGTPEHRRMLIKTCWLVAFADRKISDVEKKTVEGWAAALDVSAADCAELKSQVKDYLVGELGKHIKNTEALVAISKELGAL